MKIFDTNEIDGGKYMMGSRVDYPENSELILEIKC